MKKRIAFFGSIILFVAAALFGFLEPAETGVFRVLRPLFIFTDAAGRLVGSVTSTIIHIPYNSEDVRALREQTAILSAELANKKELERENALLREMAGRSAEEESHILARVIGRSFDGLDDFIVLDVGRDHNISNGSPVLIAGNIHLGFVEDVAEQSARVRLLSRMGEKQEVYLPESSVSSVAKGEGLGVIVLQIPDSISITEGEPVFSAGRRDYLVGFVETVEQSDEGPFQIIKTGLPLSIRDVRDVFIVAPDTNNE